MNRYLMFLLVFVWCSSAYAGDLLKKIIADEMLENGSIAIVTALDGVYLVAVGVSQLRDQRAESRKKAILVAKVNAQKRLSEFVNGSIVDAEETMEAINSAGKTEGRLNSRRWEEYEEVIRDVTKGGLANLVEVGSWERAGYYHHAVGLKLRK